MDKNQTTQNAVTAALASIDTKDIEKAARRMFHVSLQERKSDAQKKFFDAEASLVLPAFHENAAQACASAVIALAVNDTLMRADEDRKHAAKKQKIKKWRSLPLPEFYPASLEYDLEHAKNQVLKRMKALEKDEFQQARVIYQQTIHDLPPFEITEKGKGSHSLSNLRTFDNPTGEMEYDKLTASNKDIVDEAFEKWINDNGLLTAQHTAAKPQLLENTALFNYYRDRLRTLHPRNVGIVSRYGMSVDIGNGILPRNYANPEIKGILGGGHGPEGGKSFHPFQEAPFALPTRASHFPRMGEESFGDPSDTAIAGYFAQRPEMRFGTGYWSGKNFSDRKSPPAPKSPEDMPLDQGLHFTANPDRGSLNRVAAGPLGRNRYKPKPGDFDTPYRPIGINDSNGHGFLNEDELIRRIRKSPKPVITTKDRKEIIDSATVDLIVERGLCERNTIIQALQDEEIDINYQASRSAVNINDINGLARSWGASIKQRKSKNASDSRGKE